MLAVVGIASGTFLAGCLGGLAVANLPSNDGPSDALPPSPAVAEVTTPATEGSGAPSPEPSEVKILAIPDDLVGQNAAVAEDELHRLGFTNVQFASTDVDDTVVLLPPNWTVVEVAPEPGREVPADAALVLTCTKQ